MGHTGQCAEIVTIQVQLKSQKDLEWFYSAVPPTTTTTNFSQQPDIQLS